MYVVGRANPPLNQEFQIELRIVEMKVVPTWSWIHIPYLTIQIGNPMAMIKSSCHLELSFWGRGGRVWTCPVSGPQKCDPPTNSRGEYLSMTVLWSKDRMVGGLTNHRVRGHLWELLSVKNFQPLLWWSVIQKKCVNTFPATFVVVIHLKECAKISSHFCCLH
jgi:hypothetical protein